MSKPSSSVRQEAAVAEPPATRPPASRPPVARAVEAAPAVITNAAVVGFALWTVLYHAAFLVGARPTTTFVTWLVVGLVLAGTMLVRRRRAGPSDLEVTQGGTDDATGAGPVWPSRRWLLVAVTAAVVAAVAAGFGRSWLSWWVPVLAGLVAVGCTVESLRRTSRTSSAASTTGFPRPRPSLAQSTYALLVSLAVGVSSLFLARNTPDDVYYVGKSVWVAERNFVPLRDFLFTENVAHPLTTEPPISSIEVFYGALARVLHIKAASATWYVALPVMAVIAALALWRLIHLWAPRRPVLAFTVALAYLYLVVGADAALGTFHLPRLYEGKGMFVSAAVPLLWVYVTKWVDSRSRRDLAMIVALSIAATGLSTASIMILPLAASAIVFALIIRRRWRDALLGLAAIVTYPVGAAVVTWLTLGGLTSTIVTQQFFDGELTYRRTLLIGVLGVIGGLAVWCGPFLTRRGTPTLLAAAAGATLTVLLIPGVLEILRDATGLSAVLWRVPWLFPLPVLIGLLCTVDLPRQRGATGIVVALALVGSFAVKGTPLWSAESFVTVHSAPTWKLPQDRQTLAFWMSGLDRKPGLLLAPSTLMRTMPMVTSRVRVVSPRGSYLIDYDLNAQFSKDRLALTALADGHPTVPVADLAAAMDRLGVSTVCVYASNHAALDAAAALGLREFATRQRPHAMVCLSRDAT